MGQFLSLGFFTDVESSLNSEQFKNDLNSARPPISGKEALNALQTAEYMDHYRQNVENSSVNMSARQNQEYMPYPYSVSLSVPTSESWPNGQVIWMDSSADGGLPHTRAPYYICLPINIPDAALDKTLVHERIHLSQRAHTREWQKLFELAWDMTPWYGKIPPRVQFLRRINPDLVNVPLYIWKNEWVVLCVFTSSTPKNLLETQLVWLHTPSSTIHNDAPPGWTEFFGDNPSGEHPYEISAYLLSENNSDVPALDAIMVNISSVYEN